MRHNRRAPVLVALGVASALLSQGDLMGQSASPLAAPLDDGYQLFYNGQYAAAATFALARCAPGAEELAACELATSALHFEIRRKLRDRDRTLTWEQCVDCQPLLTTFLAATARGQANARAQLAQGAADRETRFLLAKLDLNYVWLHLGTLGRKTGLKEYREGRRLLDGVLAEDANHVRAQVARGWVDYIVATRMPRGTRWILGGGNKDKGVRVVRDAAARPASFFVATEAAFALWDMQLREKDVAGAIVTARRLARDFPRNEELERFLLANERQLE